MVVLWPVVNLSWCGLCEVVNNLCYTFMVSNWYDTILLLVQLSINSTLSSWKNRKDKSCFSKQLIKKLIDHCTAVVHLPLYRNFPGLKMLYLYSNHLVARLNPDKLVKCNPKINTSLHQIGFPKVSGRPSKTWMDVRKEKEGRGNGKTSNRNCTGRRRTKRWLSIFCKWWLSNFW